MKKDYRHRHIQLSNEFYANLAQNQVCFFCLPPICTQFWRKVTSTPASSTLRHIHKQFIIAEQWLLLKFCMTLIFSILPQKVILSRSKRGSQTSFQKQIKLIFVISRSECIIKVAPIFEIVKLKSMTHPTAQRERGQPLRQAASVFINIYFADQDLRFEINQSLYFDVR